MNAKKEEPFYTFSDETGIGQKFGNDYIKEIEKILDSVPDPVEDNNETTKAPQIGASDFVDLSDFDKAFNFDEM